MKKFSFFLDIRICFLIFNRVLGLMIYSNENPGQEKIINERANDRISIKYME